MLKVLYAAKKVAVEKDAEKKENARTNQRKKEIKVIEKIMQQMYKCSKVRMFKKLQKSKKMQQ